MADEIVNQKSALNGNFFELHWMLLGFMWIGIASSSTISFVHSYRDGLHR